jgi:hypothetical protein
MVDFICLMNILFQDVPHWVCHRNKLARKTNAPQGATPHATNRLANRKAFALDGKERLRQPCPSQEAARLLH